MMPHLMVTQLFHIDVKQYQRKYQSPKELHNAEAEDRTFLINTNARGRRRTSRSSAAHPNSQNWSRICFVGIVGKHLIWQRGGLN